MKTNILLGTDRIYTEWNLNTIKPSAMLSQLIADSNIFVLTRYRLVRYRQRLPPVKGIFATKWSLFYKTPTSFPGSFISRPPPRKKSFFGGGGREMKEPGNEVDKTRASDLVCCRFWYLLGVEKSLNHALLVPLRVKTKIPDEHPRPFHMGVPPPPTPGTVSLPDMRTVDWMTVDTISRHSMPAQSRKLFQPF